MKRLRTKKQVSLASNKEILENLDFYLKHHKTPAQKLSYQKFMIRVLDRLEPESKTQVLKTMHQQTKRMNTLLENSTDKKTQKVVNDFKVFDNEYGYQLQ